MYTSKDGWAVISNNNQGEYTLSHAIETISKNVWLKHFTIFLTTEDNQFQKELNDFLIKNYPEQHTQAMNSAGNMHNPKVIALHTPFKEAIMASSTVNELNNSLASRCERISSASFEKLYIRKKAEHPTYNAIVWLSTKQCKPVTDETLLPNAKKQTRKSASLYQVAI